MFSFLTCSTFEERGFRSSKCPAPARGGMSTTVQNLPDASRGGVQLTYACWMCYVRFGPCHLLLARAQTAGYNQEDETLLAEAETHAIDVSIDIEQNMINHQG